MGCPLYLAMTAAEFSAAVPLPPKPAWMACHFSPYGTGLSNLPQRMPEDGMLILNDWYPVQNHSPEQIRDELYALVSKFHIQRLLLDMQRPHQPHPQRIVDCIVCDPPCDVGVSPLYDTGHCAVFLPPPPPDMPIDTYLECCQGRKIWLEVTTESTCLEVTQQGCREVAEELPQTTTEHWDPALFCHYRIHLQKDRISFSLYRKKDDILQLLNSPQAERVECAVALCQDFSKRKTALQM